MGLAVGGGSEWSHGYDWRWWQLHYTTLHGMQQAYQLPHLQKRAKCYPCEKEGCDEVKSDESMTP